MRQSFDASFKDMVILVFSLFRFNTWYVMTLVKHMPNLTIICEIFGANLVPKLKIVNLSWSLVSTLIRRCRTHLCFSGFPFFEYAEFSGGIYFFYFRPKITLLSKCGPKNPNCQFKLKLVTYYHFHEILRLFHGWANFSFTTNGAKRDY